MPVASGYARYAARVGALAVAFGVGVAVATTPCVAWADQDSTPDVSSSPEAPGQEQEPAHPAAPDSPATSGPDALSPDLLPSSGETASPETLAVGDSPEVTYGNSGGAHTSDVGDIGPEAAAAEAIEPPPAGRIASAALPHVEAQPPAPELPPNPAAASAPVTSGEVQDSGAASWGDGAAPASPRRSAGRADDTAGNVGTATGSRMASATHTAEASGQMAMVSAVEGSGAATVDPAMMAFPSTLLNVASGLMAAVLAPLVVSGPGVPAEPPLLWTLLGWARRQLGNQRPTSDGGWLPAVALPTAPNGEPFRFADARSTVDPATGWVSGYVFTENPDDDRMSYGGSGPTRKGSVVVYEDASFLYKPSDEARHQAAAMGGDQDTFTITVSGGPGGIRSIPVTVDVLPTV